MGKRWLKSSPCQSHREIPLRRIDDLFVIIFLIPLNILNDNYVHERAILLIDKTVKWLFAMCDRVCSVHDRYLL